VARRILLDVTPLRASPDFRLLWTGQLVSVIGRQVTTVAVPFQVFQLTGSSLMVGLVSAAQLGPLLACSLVGGSVAATTVWRLRPLPPHGGGTRAGIASILEGLHFLRGRRALQGTFVIDVNAMVFGMPRALFPALGTGLFGGGPATVGLLYAAPGAGALVAALTTGWVTSVRRQGRAVVVAVIVWGAAVAAFGAVSWLPLALALLAVAGAADVVSAVFRNTILQLSVPDRLRGRLSSVHIGVVTGGPLLGDAEAGAVAAVTTPQTAVVSGGLACVAGALVVARMLPQLARWTMDDAVADDAPTPEQATTGPPGS